MYMVNINFPFLNPGKCIQLPSCQRFSLGKNLVGNVLTPWDLYLLNPWELKKILSDD